MKKLSLVLLLAACGTQTSTEPVDANAPPSDAAPVDAGTTDAAPVDAGPGMPPCLEDGPDYEPPAPLPPLPVTPAYLGSKTIDVSAIRPKTTYPTRIAAPVALSGSHLGMLLHNGFLVMDLAGNVLKTVPTTSTNWFVDISVIADKSGFYYSADAIYAVDASGNPRWKRKLRTNIDERISEVHDGVATTLLLDPEKGALYGTGTDGYLYALQALDGKLLWEKRFLDRVQLGTVTIAGGVGSRVSVRFPTERTAQVDVSSGAVIGELKIDQQPAMPLRFSTRGVSQAYSPFTLNRWILGRCNDILFDHGTRESTDLYSFLWSFDNVIVKAMAVKGTEERRLRVETETGVIKQDIPSTARLAAIGADGLTYAFEPKGSAFRLIAFDQTLREVWSLDVPSQTLSPPVLLDDGRLIWFDEKQNREAGAVVMNTVQTRSPGLAHTGHPILGHDNQRTNWAHSWK